MAILDGPACARARIAIVIQVSLHPLVLASWQGATRIFTTTVSDVRGRLARSTSANRASPHQSAFDLAKSIKLAGAR